MPGAGESSLPARLAASMGPPCVFVVRKFPFSHTSCLPSVSQKAPSGSAWVHEISTTATALMARRDGSRVRLFTRRGYDWSGKHSWIVAALRSPRVRSIIVDREAVWAGKDGNRISTSCIAVMSIGGGKAFRASKDNLVQFINMREKPRGKRERVLLVKETKKKK